jgi:hypothetical protein
MEADKFENKIERRLTIAVENKAYVEEYSFWLSKTECYQIRVTKEYLKGQASEERVLI